MSMLPSDRYLASLLGLTEEQFAYFQAEARENAKKYPTDGPTAGLETATVIAIVQLVVGVGLLVASALLKPSIPQRRQPGQPQTSEEIDDPIQTNTNFAPRYGFDSIQRVTKIGSAIPLVYTKRMINFNRIGGVRINMPMIWSQMLSFGTSQMLRGVFLLSESDIGSVDNDLWAIGSTLLTGYKFESNSATEAAARATIYLSKDGGYILESDRVFGRSAVNDRKANGGGSSSTNSTTFVFRVKRDGAERTDFCAAHKLSSQNTFGVYAPIGNDLTYKVNPIIQPGVRSQYQPGADVERMRVECPVDAAKMNTRDQYRANFSTFSGLTEVNGSSPVSPGNDNLAVGDNVTYLLSSTSDTAQVFTAYGTSDDGAECKNLASTVASKQRNWDSNLIIGEVYKIGSALGVCTARTANAIFNSDADTGASQSIEATFEIVKAGTALISTAAHLNNQGGDAGVRRVGTNSGHLLRYAASYVTNTRACRATEFGFESVVGIRFNGLCNFRDTKTYQYADESYCQAFENAEDEFIKSSLYQSGTVTASEERYSFFEISYRQAVASAYTKVAHRFGVKSEQQQVIFNFIRLEFGQTQEREFKIEPLSGYEVRFNKDGTGTFSGNYYVLDAALSELSIAVSGTTVVFNGKQITNNSTTFGSQFSRAGAVTLNNSYDFNPATGESDVTYNGLVEVDGTDQYIDSYLKLAEQFIYDQISCTAESSPEHKIAYINEISVNGNDSSTFVPTYEDLATAGINIRSSQEWRQFPQFSAYVTSGIQARRLLYSLSVGHVFLMPDVALDLLTNDRYGMGEYIVDEMIDLASFEEAAQWCSDRAYYFNGAIAEQTNLRQYIADIAASYLLYFAEINGQYVLKPLLPVSGSSFVAADIKGLFTAGNIIEGSYKMSYLDPEDREPIQISVTYREERNFDDANGKGGFPVNREVLVKESSASYAPLTTETLDMSGYCTTREHAIDAAKFLIRMKRIPEHTIQFTTTYEAFVASFGPGDYIKVAMDTNVYDEFNNGVVTDSGALVSTKAYADGTHSVYAWDPNSGVDPAAATLTVSNGGKTATPTGIVFTEIISSQAGSTYQVERIVPGENGTFKIDALHMPVNSSGVPLVADGFDTASNWTIV